ncbi:MAG: OmpH family outer membrane protein [Sphingobacteriales bacterium]|nr:OmpH family outer membrane protein [Sphingobacteriales bacterium]
MKNGLLIWNVILSLVAGLLLFLQLGPKKNKTGNGKVSARDTTVNRQFRIAYFEMDSVEANFNMVKDVKAEINTREIEYSSNLNQLDETYKRKYNELASRQYTSKEEEDEAQNILRELGEKLKIQKQDFDQKYQEFVMRKNLDVKKKIEEFLAEYNKTKNYSYIISYEQGLFYFRDTAYNITADLIKGLNEFYKPGKNK